jgi:EmrB/QacA subfamily drug resistance transporter
VHLQFPPVRVGELAERLLVPGPGAPQGRLLHHGSMPRAGDSFGRTVPFAAPAVSEQAAPHGWPRHRGEGDENSMSETSRNGLRRGWTLAVTSVAFFMVALDALVVITALPVIGRDLYAGMATLQWTVNSYGLAYAAGIITAAAIGDRYGRRRVFTAGLAVFTLASAGCALAPSVGWLLAARTVQGIGAAAVMPLSLTILTGAFPPRRRGAIVGIWGGLGRLAVAGGPLIGGAVTEGLDWHWIFWLNVPIGLAAVALSRARLPESHGHRARLDIPALVLLSGGASALVWGLVRASAAGWQSPGTLTALGCGALLVAAFVAWERRTAAPMLPPRMFRIREFTAANAAALLMIASLSAAVFLIAQYCQLVLGYSPLGTGLRILPWTATPLLIAPAAGRISDRIGRRPVLAAGLLLQAAGLGWFAQLTRGRHPSTTDRRDHEQIPITEGNRHDRHHQPRTGHRTRLPPSLDQPRPGHRHDLHRRRHRLRRAGRPPPRCRGVPGVHGPVRADPHRRQADRRLWRQRDRARHLLHRNPAGEKRSRRRVRHRQERQDHLQPVRLRPRPVRRRPPGLALSGPAHRGPPPGRGGALDAMQDIVYAFIVSAESVEGVRHGALQGRGIEHVPCHARTRSPYEGRG